MAAEDLSVDALGTPPLIADEASSLSPDGGNARSSTDNSSPPEVDVGGPVSNAGTTTFPPMKTDKPKPHVCGMCRRGFARLEHLKRHERSHTKEKPFECPECTRCFARRDLLLRHQQKLHLTATTSSRPRSGRRESTSGLPANGAGRVRKNSLANSATVGAGGANTTTMRPRANTISHIGGVTLGMIPHNVGTIKNVGHPTGHARHPTFGGFSGLENYNFRGMSSNAAHYGHHQALPKLDTNNFGMYHSGGLRTAPPLGSMYEGFSLDHLFGPDSTVNPAQLHFGDASGTPQSPHSYGFPPFHPGPMTRDNEDRFAWARGLESTADYMNGHDVAVDASSNSPMSTAGQSIGSEAMLESSNQPLPAPPSTWQHAIKQRHAMAPPAFPLDNSGPTFAEAPSRFEGLSPGAFRAQNGLTFDTFPVSPPVGTMDGSYAMPDLSHQVYNQHVGFGSDRTSVSSSSMNSSRDRHSSVTSTTTDTIAEAVRQTLIIGLSKSTNSERAVRTSPLSSTSPATSPTHQSPSPGVMLPSAPDLQRFVNAYICYFNPHLPFLHIPTLSFDSSAVSNTGRDHSDQVDLAHGGGCLFLSMAAIGALYELEHAIAKDLSESAQRLIRVYLEERYTADKAGMSSASSHTPLWLIQAVMLNLVYGYQCGERTVGDAVFNLCANVVNLVRAAELMKPHHSFVSQPLHANSQLRRYSNGDILMGDGYMSQGPWHSHGQQDDSLNLHALWLRWRTAEERKRTLFATFFLSSLLVSAFNHAPALMNSEIYLDLPCDENLWAADSAQMWYAMGGATLAQEKSLSFASTLRDLLTASQRQPYDDVMHPRLQQLFGSGMPRDQLPESELRPSTFGCLVLISALHNYIWETRQRHKDTQWTVQETEAMHAHIEPALRAWQAAWASNPQHRLERPNPFGLGPLAADSIPLLDLAYVRLFVDLGQSKEAFWRRDFKGVADEIARGAENVQQAELPPPLTRPSNPSRKPSNAFAEASLATQVPQQQGSKIKEEETTANMASKYLPSQSTRRERNLRKAAFYAADSLSMADKLGVTFAEFSSRDLPIQSAMCAFDCAQVLAEWVATVQDRVGRHVGILGAENFSFDAAPGLMLLEDEDYKLLAKIADIVTNVEAKVAYDMQGMGGMPGMTVMTTPAARQSGYGAKILSITAYMLEKAMIWPVTHLMARSLETQADQMSKRAEASLRNELN